MSSAVLAAAFADTNITENVTLLEDADWRGQGTVSIAQGATLDLNGHNLSISGLSGGGTIVDTASRHSSYRYYRFIVDATLGGQPLQVSELKLYDGDTDITQNRVSVLWDETNFNASFITGYNPTKLVDGSLDTKWYDDRAQSGNANADRVWLTLEYAEPVGVTRYEWYTADANSNNNVWKRNPSAWRLQGSNDNVSWVNLDVVENFTPPSRADKTLAYETDLSSNGNGLWIDVSSSAGYGFSGDCDVAVYVGDGTLTSDCDLRCFGTKLVVCGFVGLAGHRLLTAAASGSGRISSAFVYRYYRFIVDATLGGQPLQVSELKLYNGDTEITQNRVSVLWDETNFNASFITGYNPTKLVDGSLDTKWYDDRAQSGNANADRVWLTLEYAEPVGVTRYEWYTADANSNNNVWKRNPSAWRLQGSNDNVSWTDLDAVVNFTPPERADKTLAYQIENDGELCVDVADGKEVINTSLELADGMRLVKTGAGTFVAAKTGQSYKGGTIVENGFLKPGVNEATVFGANGTTLTIASGAQYCDDLYAYRATYLHDFIIAGDGPDGSGAIRSTARAPSGTNNALSPWARSLTLAGDAVIGSDTFSFDFVADNCSVFPLTLNGHALTLKSASTSAQRVYPYFLVSNVQSTDEGTIVVEDGLSFYPYRYEVSVLTNITLVISETGEYTTETDSYARDLVVSNLIYRSASATSQTSHSTTVLGCYKPTSATSAPKVVLGDATHLSPTLDLSGCTGTFNIAFGGGLTFAEGTTVSVKLGDRKAQKKLLGWAEGTGPVDVNFVLADAKGYLEVKSDGVYRQTGFIIIVK